MYPDVIAKKHKTMHHSSSLLCWHRAKVATYWGSSRFYFLRFLRVFFFASSAIKTNVAVTRPLIN
jgi:hypothetical protein